MVAGEELLKQTTSCFFGPMRVSVLLDANGSNTTAAAAVIAAGRHVSLEPSITAAVLGTGPVGQRAALMLASEGVTVKIVSRTTSRAAETCQTLEAMFEADNESGKFVPVGTAQTPIEEAIEGCEIIIAAGPAGVEMLTKEARQGAQSLQVAIDLNAVPPLGIGGLEVTDKAAEHDGQLCYGAIGVGGTKMKIHKAAIRRLFESNDAVLDAAEVYAIGKELEV